VKYLAATLTCLAVLAPLSRATDYTSAATVSATFQCPEALPSDEARAAELKAYIDWMRAQHPDWTPATTMGYRLYLLETRHCDTTIAAIQATKTVH
jgi:hypothetical protein